MAQAVRRGSQLDDMRVASAGAAGAGRAAARVAAQAARYLALPR